MSEQPQKKCGALSVIVICATIAFIAHLFISQHPAVARRLWDPGGGG